MEKKTKDKNFKKATFIEVVKFKIKWIAKILWFVINYPFDLLFDLI